MNLQAACSDEQASKYAAYLQSQAGKQQLESASGLSLPTGTSLMGLPQYGRQLYMRPSYLQLRDILAQLFKDAVPYVDKTVLVSGTPGIGKSFCALYLATHFIAQGIRVVYEFHPIIAAGSTIWYHFPLSGIISHPTAARVLSATVGRRSSLTQMMRLLFTSWMAASHLFPLLCAGAMPF